MLPELFPKERKKKKAQGKQAEGTRLILSMCHSKCHSQV